MKTLLLFAMTPALLSAQPAPTAAAHLKVARSHSFVVNLPVEKAFPLFEPLGEKNWAEGWHPVFPAADDLPLHDGSVFTVEAPHPHGQGIMKSVWTVTAHQPPHAIEYRNVIVGLRATRIEVRCAAAPGGTRVTVSYTYTGLSDEGDKLIREITPERYVTMIDGWGTAIATYLKRGTPATP